MIALIIAAQQALTIPAYSAYSEPSPNRIEIDDQASVSGWQDPKQALAWYGEARSSGTINLKVILSQPTTARLTLTAGKTTRTLTSSSTVFDFGNFEVFSGTLRVGLKTDMAPGPAVQSLQAIGDVHWTTSKRRNAASVHLRWPKPASADVRWFYNEAGMITDPQWSYTMACGFARGYFGMQVNSPTERRIIFSVWDSGTEAVSRDKVAADDRVQLIAKGKDVVADSFGNEGTGGHSHLVLPWKTGKRVKFLVGCRPEGNHTLYAGYFMAPGDNAWRLVAAFRAPKDGKSLDHLYSFSENFGGANGQLWRESEYGHGWLGMADGTWKPITQATFTTDGHGKTERWDYDAFIKGGLFHLRHGGFVAGTANYGDTLNLAKPEKRPKLDLPTLP